MNVQNVAAQNITCVRLTQTSDLRLKERVQEGTKYGLDDLLKIKVRDAVLSGEEIQRPTIIAQELQPLMPEFVVADSDGVLSIDYTGLVPVLVKSLQDLQRKLERERHGQTS